MTPRPRVACGGGAVRPLARTRVPGLVHRPEKKSEGLVADPTRGDPHVVRPDTRGERMNGPVLPASGPVEAEGGSHLDRERQHLGLCVGAGEKARIDRWPGADGGDERHLAWTQLGKEGPHVRRGHARLVVVEQHVMRVSRGWEERDVLPLQFQHAREVRGEGGEVVVGSGAFPGVLRRRNGLGVVGDERGRHPQRLLVVARGDGREPAGLGAGVGLTHERDNGGPHLVAGKRLVRETAQRRLHLAVNGCALRWHADALVPLDEFGRATEVGHRCIVSMERGERSLDRRHMGPHDTANAVVRARRA